MNQKTVLLLSALFSFFGTGFLSTVQAIDAEQSQAVVLLRGLPTLDTVHSIAIVEIDPEAENFGAILTEFDVKPVSVSVTASGPYW